MLKEIAQELKDKYDSKYSEDLHITKLLLNEIQAAADMRDTTGTDYASELQAKIIDACYEALKILETIDDEPVEDDSERDPFEAEAEFCRNNFGRIFI